MKQLVIPRPVISTSISQSFKDISDRLVNKEITIDQAKKAYKFLSKLNRSNRKEIIKYSKEYTSYERDLVKKWRERLSDEQRTAILKYSNEYRQKLRDDLDPSYVAYREAVNSGLRVKQVKKLIPDLIEVRKEIIKCKRSINNKLKPKTNDKN